MTASRPIRLICLDLDDTLWPCLPTILRAEQAMHDWLQVAAPTLAGAHTVASLRAHRQKVAQANPGQAHDLTALRRVALQQLLPVYGHPPSLAESACEVFRHHRNQVEPYPDVIPVLRQLRRDFTLIALSNGNAQLEQTPLAGLFHHAFSAEQVGAAKPDPALFMAAVAAAGVAPTQTLHVGDDPLRDIQPARDLGMAVVWMNRGASPWPADAGPPPAMVSGLRGLLPLLPTRPVEPDVPAG